MEAAWWRGGEGGLATADRWGDALGYDGLPPRISGPDRHPL